MRIVIVALSALLLAVSAVAAEAPMKKEGEEKPAISPTGPAAEARYRKGAEAFLKGAYTDAYEAWKPLAEAGHARAQLGLSKLYARGLGVDKQDDKAAAEWLEKAAEGGLADAQYAFADMLFYGKGIDEDRKRAAAFYERAAKQGHAGAKFKLAAIYFAGQGVERDEVKALRLYREAADGGNRVAMTTMGVFYFNGQVVKRNIEEARKWWEKAAYAGEVNAMVFLARIWHRSTHHPRDYKKAYIWYSIAAERGDVSAAKERNELRRLMRTIEIKRAEEELPAIREKVKK
jgi:TPR repeat protein